uniref:Uncharacterized protein n=1 Tax=Polytomella parva TaxID=51329 RepID=A0A7S0Y8C3_9CHLO|mmetsp:Transcript_13500/g.23875  ORF Transcript_13500/g.23875 Transcript_13500/m.23875 type:complete len:415 (+) Transcript_13500:56-1300(+)
METSKFKTTQVEVDIDMCKETFRGREIVLYQPGGPVTFNGESLYKSEFQAYELDPPTSYQPPKKGVSPPFQGTSSYRDEFKEHHIEPRHGYIPPTIPKTPGSFDATSLYKESYTAHPVDPEVFAQKAVQYHPSTAAFSGQSSYRENFKEHPLERRPPSQTPVPKTTPFEGQSSYREDFQRPVVSPAERLAPAPPRAPSAPFAGQSSYRENFKAHAISPPVPHVPEYHPNTGAFLDSTENKDSYRAWPVNPDLYKNAAPPPLRPSLPFSGSTTNQDAYKGWKIHVPRPALSVQMAGDRSTVLIASNSPLPAVGSQIFTTVRDNQSEICVIAMLGSSATASQNRILGQFVLKGLPAGPKGQTRVEVTFYLDEDQVLTATARDLDNERQAQWLKDGGVMEAQSHLAAAGKTGVMDVL